VLLLQQQQQQKSKKFPEVYSGSYQFMSTKTILHEIISSVYKQ